MKQEKKPSAGRHTGTEAEMKIYTPHTAEQKAGAPSTVISDQHRCESTSVRLSRTSPPHRWVN